MLAEAARAEWPAYLALAEVQRAGRRFRWLPPRRWRTVQRKLRQAAPVLARARTAR